MDTKTFLQRAYDNKCKITIVNDSELKVVSPITGNVMQVVMLEDTNYDLLYQLNKTRYGEFVPVTLLDK
jgi:hypothetical protein